MNKKERLEQIEREIYKLESSIEDLAKEHRKLESEIYKECNHQETEYINLAYESGWYCKHCGKKK